MIEPTTLWTVIIGLGVGSFLLRFTFLGFVGDRPLPPWLLRHLRYTAVAVLPALVAPLVYFSNEDGTGPDPAQLGAALATLGVGYLTKNAIWAIFAGAGTLFLMIRFGGAL